MNTSVLDSLQTWALRAVGKVSRDLHDLPPVQEGPALAYRLRAWPELQEAQRTAPVYRLLSVMTVRAVTRQWMLQQSRLPEARIDALISQLAQSGELVCTELRSTAPARRPLAGVPVRRRDAIAREESAGLLVV